MAPTSNLVFMACSATKLPQAAPAFELYQGVMYGTFRSNVKPEARPHVKILSALHGFVDDDAVLEPYEQVMTSERAAHMMGNIDEFMNISIPSGVRHILLAGGVTYRRVMRAAVQRQREKGALAQDVAVKETIGGIRYQRQQLGRFLRGLEPAPEVIGRHPNGTPLYRSIGGFTVGQSVKLRYRAAAHCPAKEVVIAELFHGPMGPTANVRVLDSKYPHLAYTWVGLGDLNAQGL